MVIKFRIRKNEDELGISVVKVELPLELEELLFRLIEGFQVDSCEKLDVYVYVGECWIEKVVRVGWRRQFGYEELTEEQTEEPT